ncbi:prenyltransferase [Halieaceae bacterium IMCC14734]|uniref:Prenyltransferase n=1 Tax=Candidatus Litorirhabdus singularis TaxID=2518993 RepID=A0ABT3TBR3_9GAMM|nr:prenyltransferase [Candidatus Litorirhabdus singularis]MCX2979690.1 prenyltransferase [Candidatus Litorirhabdus singularis]
MNQNFLAGLWRLADPKISITSVASMAIGAALAWGAPGYSLSWLLLILLALFALEVAKNAWGEVFDFDSGTDLAVKPEDRTDFSGGKRVLVDGLLSRGETWAIAGLFGAVGFALGLIIVLLREPAVFWLGVAGAVLAWSYHGPPLQLAYRGLGELVVLLCYGPIIALGTFMVMTGSFSTVVIMLSLPLGLLIAAFLWVNEFPDYLADVSAGKRNLVVRLGRLRAARCLPVIYLLAFGMLASLPWLMALPLSVMLGLAAVPTALLVCKWTLAAPETWHRQKPVQPLALLTFVLYSAGVSIGVLW